MLKNEIDNMLNELKSVEIKVNNLFSIKKDVPIDYVDGHPPIEDDAYYRMVFSGIPYIANPHYETLASRDYDEIMAEITLFITDTMDSIRDSLIENMTE
jgi:hypothetical protein